MSSEENRKNIVVLIRNNIGSLANNNKLNFTEIQEYFLEKKTSSKKNASDNGKRLAKKIFGTQYICICDTEQFGNTNNFKSLTLIIFQIVFQDEYIANLIVSELKNATEYLKELKNHPLSEIVMPEDYSEVIIHCLLQLLDICEQNSDISIRFILSAYSLGLQMLSMILRVILMKLKFKGCQQCNGEYLRQKTPQIFISICEYLDINLIAKDARQNKNQQNDHSQVYLLSDYNLFIASPDNHQFLCGIYYDNQNQIRQAQKMRVSQMQILLNKSRRIDDDELSTNKRSTIQNPLRISEFQFDLGMSGSGFIFPSQQQETPFFNSNAPTPQFGLNGVFQSLKLRKSVEQDTNYLRFDKDANIQLRGSYFSIKQQDEQMQFSMNRKQKNEKQTKNQEQRIKDRQFFKPNITSVIMNRYDEQQKLQKEYKCEGSIQVKDSKQPKSPPTLAGKAELNYFKINKNQIPNIELVAQNNRPKVQQQKDKKSKQQHLYTQKFQLYQSRNNQNNNNRAKNIQVSTNQELLKIMQQPNKAQVGETKEKFRNHKGSYNQFHSRNNAALLKKIKTSDITGGTLENNLNRQKYQKMNNYLNNIEVKTYKRFSPIKQKSDVSKTSIQNRNRQSIKNDKSQGKHTNKSLSPNSAIDRKIKIDKLTNKVCKGSPVIKTQPNIQIQIDLKNKNYGQDAIISGNKARRYSEYKITQGFNIVGSKSQKLSTYQNIEHLKKRNEQNQKLLKRQHEENEMKNKKVILNSLKQKNAEDKNEKQVRVSSLKSFNAKGQPIKKSPDTQRCNKKQSRPDVRTSQIEESEMSKKYGKFPQFLRKNAVTEKKLVESTQYYRKIPQTINRLIFFDNKRSSQQKRMKLVNSPRDEKTQEQPPKKQQPTAKICQQQRSVLQKNKSTQSQPTLVFPEPSSPSSNTNERIKYLLMPQLVLELTHQIPSSVSTPTSISPVPHLQTKFDANRPKHISSHKLLLQPPPFGYQQNYRNDNRGAHSNVYTNKESNVSGMLQNQAEIMSQSQYNAGYSYLDHHRQYNNNILHEVKQPYNPGKYLVTNREKIMKCNSQNNLSYSSFPHNNSVFQQDYATIANKTANNSHNNLFQKNSLFYPATLN